MESAVSRCESGARYLWKARRDEVTSSMPPPLDENIFSDLTLFAPPQEPLSLEKKLCLVMGLHDGSTKVGAPLSPPYI
ncbi:hypothetical protein ZEAMMB73_Zm00001d007655 [Zea mays]|uniref:Uncharacterized protein n=1 Tax=Zea mays TaxID=4577 RepID=A0A1D6F7U3_MAIZE|nr:hypothetical protein ZEAMMB73_Zm00001d007655 [Zea mays]ONM27294.1 hypothetical protein ZEAMMB73_Zm00001d007655 [Zea mays]